MLDRVGWLSRYYPSVWKGIVGSQRSLAEQKASAWIPDLALPSCVNLTIFTCLCFIHSLSLPPSKVIYLLERFTDGEKEIFHSPVYSQKGCNNRLSHVKARGLELYLGLLWVLCWMVGEWRGLALGSSSVAFPSSREVDGKWSSLYGMLALQVVAVLLYLIAP